MAIGLSPKHVREIPMNGYSKERFLALSVEALKKVGWDLSFISAHGFVAYTPFSWRSYSEQFQVTIEETTLVFKSICIGTQVVDWGKNKKNVDDFLEAFQEVKTSFTEEELLEKEAAIVETLEAKSDDDSIHVPPPRTMGQKVKDAVSIFKPTNGYFVTPIIMLINIAVYIAMVVSGVDFFLPENTDMLKWGADFAPSTLNGEWWRVITCCFIHFGIVHLLFNMYALVYIGSLLEPYMGKWKFLLVYIVTGIYSSVVSLWWHEEPTVAAGASGAIFGLYGVFLAMLTTNLIEKSQRKALFASIGVFTLYNIIYGAGGNNIDNAAHIGGLVTGIILGYALTPGLKNGADHFTRYGLTLIVSIGLLGGAAYSFSNINNYALEYDKAMKEFEENEKQALSVYNMRPETTREEAMREIKEKAMHYWNKNVALINELQKKKMPSQVTARANKLKEYSECRMGQCSLLYKAIDEDTDKYDDSLQVYEKRLEAIYKELQ